MRFGRHWGALLVRADYDPAEPLAHVIQARGKRQDRHDLRRHGYVETGLARPAVRLVSQPRDNVAQGAVVHVHHPPPGDRIRVDVQPLEAHSRHGLVGERVLVHDARVHGRGQKVVRDGDRVDVAGQMQVELLHRYDLTVTPAGGSPLYAEGRAHGRLTDAEEDVLAYDPHRLGETDGGGRLALPQRRRRDGGDVNVLAIRL
jgi:hypothetical protein